MNTIKNLIKKSQSGFTLLEILLVVAAIGILAGIVIFAINPAKQLADTRNAQRRVDVNTILNAVYQYMIDNKGNLPLTMTTSEAEICRTGATSCAGLVDLSALTTAEKYLTALPIDPTVQNDNSTGYFINLTDNGHITITAGYAEGAGDISVTR